MDYSEIFYNYFLKNDVENASNIYYEYINNQFELIDILYECCKHGKLDIIKWLYSIITIEHINNDSLLLICCSYGYIDCAKFIHDIINITNTNDLIDYNKIFNTCCCNYNLELAQWIYSISPHTDYDYNKIFVNMCIRGYIIIIKWLISLNIDINIRKNNDNAFRKSIEYKKIHIVDYLCKIIDNYRYIINNNVIEYKILSDDELCKEMMIKSKYKISKFKEELYIYTWNPTRLFNWCIPFNELVDFI